MTPTLQERLRAETLKTSRDISQDERAELFTETADALDAKDKEIEGLKKALEPFARADRAIGDTEGPFRFETGTGYRLIEREDLCRAREAISPTTPTPKTSRGEKVDG